MYHAKAQELRSLGGIYLKNTNCIRNIILLNGEKLSNVR